MNEQLSLFNVVMEHHTDTAELPKIEPPKSKPTTPIFNVPTVDEIMKAIEKASYRTSRSKLVEDIFECGALAISNLVDKRQFGEREERYLEIIKKYQKPEQQAIAEIFGMIFRLLTSVTNDDGVFDDYLGTIFNRCNMANNKNGQVFTPFHISHAMAKMVIGNPAEISKDDDILTICDPCCGSGVMSLGALDVLKNDFNFNYAHNCYIECSDIDIRCVHMAYLQLSLAGVPAIIKHQNTLTLETWSVWKTPAFIFQYLRFQKFDR